MSLWQFLKRLFLGYPAPDEPTDSHTPTESPSRKPRLRGLHYSQQKKPITPTEVSKDKPHSFALREPRTGKWLNLQVAGDSQFLRDEGLPVITNPEELSHWLGISSGELAWLTHHFEPRHLPKTVDDAHYIYHWVDKRNGGQRLIEASKPRLKAVQHLILTEILNRIPVHGSCHGFTAGRSIVTNAKPHCGQRVMLKLDLENFYPSVSFNRVVAIFRSMGYNRQIAILLARLTTTAVPSSTPFPSGNLDWKLLLPYFRRHLPQGAPTSPALANLSAFSLDLRLSSLAKSWGATYTRYADDLTISGPESLLKCLKTVIPLTEQVIREERFCVNRSKRKVVRNNQQMTVCGVVVNEHPNSSRKEFDRLKAILFNCIRFGPESQNRNGIENFSDHLRGRISFVEQLNPQRSIKLEALWKQINW